MNIVLDANVLFCTLISSGPILDILFHRSIHIYAIEQLREEFINHQTEIIHRSHLPKETVTFLTEELFKKIIFVEREEY
jgi:predicted nucleic acid-binding protein